MTDTPTLFDLTPSRDSDPETSREAASKVNGQRQLELVLLTLLHARDALTDDDIAARCGLLRHSAGTRRGIAVKLGYVERAGTGKSALGNSAATWALSPDGVVYARQIQAGAA